VQRNRRGYSSLADPPEALRGLRVDLFVVPRTDLDCLL
jgi:hypothetical protein